MSEKITQEQSTEMHKIIYDEFCKKEEHSQDVFLTVHTAYHINDEEYKNKILTLAAEEYFKYIVNESYAEIQYDSSEFADVSILEIINGILKDLAMLHETYDDGKYAAIAQDFEGYDKYIKYITKLNKKISKYMAEIIRRSIQ